MKYELVAGWDLVMFNNKVTSLLMQGYSLYGNPFTTVEREVIIYSQALVKDKK